MFHAELEATSHCNIRCLHCPHEAISRPAGRMTWETFTTIVDRIRSHAKEERYSLSFSGMGEPLLNPLIYRFIRHVSAEAVTSFASNGSALTERAVAELTDAGLDRIYVSFNGDEPAIYSRMMGGLSFDKVLANVRRAVERTRGSRLQIAANVSVTKANRDRVTRIKEMLEGTGVGPISFSLCHNRGGNLRDADVCDTPPMGVDRWECDVMKNTLFVDWQGRAHICDHDLHGEYELGDLLREPLEEILARRERLVHDNSALKICRECNDIMKVGGTFPLESRAGGNFRDWVYYLHQDLSDPLSEANEPMKWIFRIYEKENRLDRFANLLMACEKEARRALLAERDVRSAERGDWLAERETLVAERARLAAEKESLQGVLDVRDREFAALHAQYVAMRRSFVWRLFNMLRNDLRRIRRLGGRLPFQKDPLIPALSKEG